MPLYFNALESYVNPHVWRTMCIEQEKIAEVHGEVNQLKAKLQKAEEEKEHLELKAGVLEKMLRMKDSNISSEFQLASLPQIQVGIVANLGWLQGAVLNCQKTSHYRHVAWYLGGVWIFACYETNMLMPLPCTCNPSAQKTSFRPSHAHVSRRGPWKCASRSCIYLLFAWVHYLSWPYDVTSYFSLLQYSRLPFPSVVSWQCSWVSLFEHQS